MLGLSFVVVVFSGYIHAQTLSVTNQPQKSIQPQLPTTPTNTSNVPHSFLASSPANQTEKLPPLINMTCSIGYFPFSEADLAASDQPGTNQTLRGKTPPKQKRDTLLTPNTTTASADVKYVACNANGKGNGGLCAIDSCTGDFPVCSSCLEILSIGPDNKTTLAQNAVDNIRCEANYYLNSSLGALACSDINQKTYQCGHCASGHFRSCTACYDVDDPSFASP
ncbi:hypothetical protein O181_026319 [Austropuccinia psidii MF-1]|uniref:Uncharacterized protein n=1 Tax=Austropuccinia psidii MF-1 TaxID=1389203 RepID=A0A9Q3CM49_9BASI|nr:hypothetical protein [Austropuccinia psidii MF-1]